MITNPYYRNKKTGELLPGDKAIHRYYKIEKHKGLDAWTDEWEETNLDADEGLSDAEISAQMENTLDDILVAFGL